MAARAEIVCLVARNATQLWAHLRPIMQEAMHLERDGLVVDLPQSLPPWGSLNVTGKHASWALDKNGKPRMARLFEPRPKSRADAKARESAAPVREILATGVVFEPTVMFAFDGATTMAGSGETFSKGDLFSETAKDDMNEFLRVVRIKRGQGFKQVADGICPGCSAPSHKHHWVVDFLAYVNRKSANAELQAVTAEPERLPAPAREASIGKQKKGRQQALFGDTASDGRTAPKQQPYKDAAFRGAYKHDAFVPELDGDGEKSATAGRDGFIRVPIEVKTFTRDLPKAIWTWANEQDITPRLALCVIHCAMRTLESSLKQMLTVLGERYLANVTKNKVSDREVIDRFLNSQIWKDCSVRKLISCDQKGNLNKVTLNGGEVRSLMHDLADPDGFLITAISKTCSELAAPVDPAVIHLRAWETTLGHWATAMKAAYVLRATPEDRQVFRERVQYYVISKAALVPDKLVWYDWQLFSVFTTMFDRYESLMLISQEGMEAVQKQNNGLQRNSNNFSNAGRVPKKVIAAGLEAIKAYMLERKKKMKSPCEWLWKKQLLLFISPFHEILERVEKYRADGHTITWDEFNDEWDYFRWSSTFCFKLIARWRRKGIGPTDREGWSRPLHTEYGCNLMKEVQDYYAPCPCESDPMFWKLRPEDAKKRLQRERRARWALAQKRRNAQTPRKSQ